MRRFGWWCVVGGLLLAVGVWTGPTSPSRAFANSSGYIVWQQLSDHDQATWRPAKLRTAVYWDSCRWPAVLGGAGLTVFGVLVLAIRRPERKTV